MFKLAISILKNGLLAALVLLTLQGCLGTAMVVGGAAAVGSVAHDRRTAGTVVDDEGIELKAFDTFVNAKETANKEVHINATSYNYKVLLTGEVPTPAIKSLATSRVADIDKVIKVINELAVAESSSFISRSKDTWITTKVKTSMFGVGLEEFDPTRVKVITERGIVYLMGIVTRAEADAAVDTARNIDGVVKVVKVFEYIEN